MTPNAKRRLLALLTVTAFCVVVGSLVFRANSRALLYQGKPVKAWLLQLSASDPAAQAEAEAALAALGTNAVPELARLLRTRDASWRNWLWNNANRLPRRLRAPVLRRVDSPNGYLVRPLAARALGKLGPGAAPAEPALVQALQDKVNGTYWAAGDALGRIGAKAVPDLARALQDRDTLVRCAAAHGLGEAGREAASAVPALVQMLEHGSAGEQQIAAQSLRKIGAAADAHR